MDINGDMDMSTNRNVDTDKDTNIDIDTDMDMISLSKCYYGNRPKYNSMEEAEKNAANHNEGDFIQILINGVWHIGMVLNKDSENKIAIVNKECIDRVYIPDVEKDKKIQSKIGTDKISTNSNTTYLTYPRYYSVEEANKDISKYKVGDYVWILLDDKWCRCLVTQKSKKELEYLVEVTNGEVNNYHTIGEVKCMIRNKNMDMYDMNRDVDMKGIDDMYDIKCQEEKYQSLEDIKANIINWLEVQWSINGECKLLRDLFISSIKHYNLICLEFREHMEDIKDGEYKHTSLYLKIAGENTRKILLGEYEQSAQSLGQELFKKWFGYTPVLGFFEKDLILDINTLKKLVEK